MTEFDVNRTVAPNEDLLKEEIDALAIGDFEISFPGAYPRDIHVIFPDDTLTAQQITDVTDTITNHVETGTTAEQDRVAQDTIDLDQVRADFDVWATQTDAQKLATLKLVCRCLLRDMRTEPI